MKLQLIFFLVIISWTLSAQEWKSLTSDDAIYNWQLSHNFDAQLNGNSISASAYSGTATALYPEVLQNFRLKMDFLLNKGGNATLAFRIPEQHTKMPTVYGYGVSLDADYNQQNTLGSIIGIARAKTIDSLDLNTWNTLEIIAEADYLRVFINDQMVAETNDRRSSAGTLGLTVNDKGLQLRNVSYAPLKDAHPGRPLIEDLIRSHPGTEYESIFDGETLNGWTATGTSTWDVADGVLHGYSGADGGFLVSEGAYHNFHMKFKFKIIQEDNSGIFIRNPVGKDVAISHSVECNIYDLTTYTHPYSTGSLATHARAWSFVTDYEDWNTGDIYAYEDQVVMYINGIKTAQATLPDLNHNGNICLQAGIKIFTDRGPSDIYFKDLWVKKIE